MKTLKNKIQDWNFFESKTKYATHGFHTYPAMMVPQVAEHLIKEFGKKSKLIFDPYCGSGTSLVEANLAGIDSIGTDINPLARLIARVKTNFIEQQTIDFYLKDFYDFLFQYRFGLVKRDSIVIPKFTNIDYWFSKSIITDLAIIKQYIDNIENSPVQEFFTVAFSQTIRECSWTRKNEYKLYKMDSNKIKNFKPDTFTTFENILSRNRNGLIEFFVKKNNLSKSEIYDFDTVNIIPSEIIKDSEINFVLTSPPYGDSQTTVAYGQFSRLTNQWLDVPNANKLDSELMGGKKNDNTEKFVSTLLNHCIDRISNIDGERVKDVYSFYHDYFNSISNISKSISKKGFACYVVSNRCVRGVTLPTHIITKEFFEENGLAHKHTFERNISSKRLPRRNSPSGVAGVSNDLMNHEYIVVMQKS